MPNRGSGAMPNGGSDCCGTCWFNRANGGERGSVNHDRAIPSYCEIRELEIPDPGYTDCANHPYHRPQRDNIPIGPVNVHRSERVEIEPGHFEEIEGRFPWVPSPDSEEIRRHLLSLIEEPEKQVDEHYHFYTGPAVWVALDQLIKLGEPRAIPIVERLIRESESAGEDASGLRGALTRLGG